MIGFVQSAYEFLLTSHFTFFLTIHNLKKGLGPILTRCFCGSIPFLLVANESPAISASEATRHHIQRLLFESCHLRHPWTACSINTRYDWV